MYRTTQSPILLLIFSAVACMVTQAAQEHSFAHGFFNTGPSFGGEKTAVCFLNDEGEGTNWHSAVKNEFIKLTIDKAPHIFVTANTIKAFQTFKKNCLQAFAGLKITNPFKDILIKNNNLIKIAGEDTPVQYQHLVKNLTAVLSFSLEKWDVYNTDNGLLYIHHKEAPYIEGIKYKNFRRIANLDDATVGSTSQVWTRNLNALFNHEQWNSTTKKHDKQTFIFFCGHGSPVGGNEHACGLTASTFADILNYFNKNLNFEMLGVITCFWPADRILKLMQQKHGSHTLNFTLCTPISLQEPVYTDWHPTIDNHENGKTTYKKGFDSFFQGLKGAVSNIKNIAGLKGIFKKVDAAIISRGRSRYVYQQKPTIIYAHSTQVQEL